MFRKDTVFLTGDVNNKIDIGMKRNRPFGLPFHLGVPDGTPDLPAGVRSDSGASNRYA